MNPNPANPIFFISFLQSCSSQPVRRLPSPTVLIKFEIHVVIRIGKRNNFFEGVIRIIRYKYLFPVDFYIISNKIEVVKVHPNQE